MKWVNGKIIIKQVLDSWNEYDQIPVDATDMLERLMDNLHYERKKITADRMLHFFKYYDHLFEEDILEKLSNEFVEEQKEKENE